MLSSVRLVITGEKSLGDDDFWRRKRQKEEWKWNLATVIFTVPLAGQIQHNLLFWIHECDARCEMDNHRRVQSSAKMGTDEEYVYRLCERTGLNGAMRSEHFQKALCGFCEEHAEAFYRSDKIVSLFCVAAGCRPCFWRTDLFLDCFIFSELH